MVRVKEKLKEIGVKPSKSRGQNFLIDENVLQNICAQGKASPADNIIEIGPGLGALTKYIYQIAPHTAIEIEPAFCAALKEKFSELKIINQDVRDVDFASLGNELIIFGNLPYSFSTDIIFHLAKFGSNVKRMVFLLQKEFAERMAAKPGGKDYGVLTVGVQLEFKVSLGIEVPGNSFHPPTKVTSRVVILEPLDVPKVVPEKIEWLKKTVRASFLQRRKKIANSIKAASLIALPNAIELIKNACLQCEISPDRRAETLTIDEFIRLADALRDLVRH